MEGELRIIELYYKRRVLPVGFSCVGFSRLCGVPELPEALAPPIDLPTNYVCLNFQFIFITPFSSCPSTGLIPCVHTFVSVTRLRS